MDAKALGTMSAILLTLLLTFAIGRSLKSGRAPSLIRVGHSPVGPELSRERSPILFWFSTLVMVGVWLVLVCALLKLYLGSV